MSVGGLKVIMDLVRIWGRLRRLKRMGKRWYVKSDRTFITSTVYEWNTDDQAEVTLPTKQEDVDALWSQARSELRVPPEKLKEKRSPETKRNDGEYLFSCLLLFSLPLPSP